MKEVAVVVGLDGEAIHWHDPPDSTVVYIQDSRSLWDVVWENRANLKGVAHSHPGSGIPTPSWEDVTSFAGQEQALGKRLEWFITSGDRVAMFWWEGPGKYDYRGAELAHTPTWVGELRRLSGYEANNKRGA